MIKDNDQILNYINIITQKNSILLRKKENLFTYFISLINKPKILNTKKSYKYMSVILTML